MITHPERFLQAFYTPCIDAACCTLGLRAVWVLSTAIKFYQLLRLLLYDFPTIHSLVMITVFSAFNGKNLRIVIQWKISGENCTFSFGPLLDVV